MPLATFIDLQNEALGFGFNDGPQVNRGRIKNWLNEAEFQIAREVEGPEFQKVQVFPLTAGVASYALPSDFARAQDITYPAMSIRLRPVDIQDYDLSSATVVMGPPATYTLYQTNLLLFPTPNSSSDVLNMHYIAFPPPMINDSDVPVLIPNYLHLLVDYAVCRAFEAEDDYEAAQYFQTRYTKDLAAYASDVQWRELDRPRQVDGTWSQGSGRGGGGGW